MHWTPEQIVELIKALTPFIAALGTLLSGMNFWQIRRARADVQQVHACLSEARDETRTDVQAAKEEATQAKVAAAVTAETVNRLEINTNDKMDKLLISTNAASYQAGADAANIENQKVSS